MKKIAFIFAITLISISCDPKKWVATHATSWYAKNNTDQILINTTSPFIDTDAVVAPGDSVLVHSFNPFQYLGEPTFDTFYDAWNGKPEQEWCISICSKDGQLLKIWKYIDRNAEGRQFFNESFWRLYTKKYSHSDQLNFSWVFNILPEDIALL